jgi:F-type H+-transporting ATPase subunit b
VPGLISGLEISAGGRKLAWSIADYMSGLEQSIGEILPPQSAPAAEPAPAAPITVSAART